MSIQLTIEPEQRLQAVVHSGAYRSVEDVLEAAVTAVEQRSMPGFEGSEQELEELLLAGVQAATVTDEDFWRTVSRTSDRMLTEHKTRSRQ